MYRSRCYPPHNTPAVESLSENEEEFHCHDAKEEKDEGKIELDLAERVFLRVRKRSRLIISNIVNTEVLEHIKQRFPVFPKRHRAMMRILLANQHIAVEPVHITNRKCTDRTKAAAGNWQNLTFRDIGAQLRPRRALQPEERNLARADIG